MASRLSAAEVLARIVNDSDSESEFELSDDDENFTRGLNGRDSSSSPSRSPSDVESVHPQHEGNGDTINRRRGRSRVRRGTRGRGRGTWGRERGNLKQARGRRIGTRQDNVQIPEFMWRDVDFYDHFDTDWCGTPRRHGVLIDTSQYEPVDFFKYFFPEDVFEIMVTNTNLYASQFLNGRDLKSHSRYHKWKDTSVEEMKAYIALLIAMGINNKPEIQDYWGTYWLTAGRFSDVMSRNRYQLLNTFLHFNNNNLRVERGLDGYDPLFKVRPLLETIDPRYLSAYAPDKELAIDESMIKFKGRIFFRQYLPLKPTKWGLKTFVLCESNTGYALRFLIYTGKNTFNVDRASPFSMTEQVCLRMTEGFENDGYRLFMDNFYSSPKLFLELKSRGLGAAGTVKASRKHMPAELQPAVSVLEKGDDPVFMRTDDLITCAMMDTKRVHFLSSIHSDNTYDKTVRARMEPEGQRTVVKPIICEDYNLHMNGVDVMDQKLGSYNYPHKSAKWYMTIFHRLREVALVNGYIIYTKSLAVNETPMSTVTFREQVIDGLLEGWAIGARKMGRPSVTELPDRLTGRHFPAQYDDKNHRPDCVVCSDRSSKRVQTRYYCRNCQKPMCPTDCFMIYHTQKDYKSALQNSE